MKDFLLILVYWIAAYKIVFFFICLFLSLALGFLIRNKKAKMLSALPGIIAFLNMFLGASQASKLIYRYGEKGQGKVVAMEQTSSQYNDQWIYKYSVLLRKADGSIVETAFYSDDFMMYPVPDNGYNYPAEGMEFELRYVKSKPGAFVIVTDGESAYSQQQRCTEAVIQMSTAKSKYDFDTASPAYKKEYLNGIQRYLDLGCVSDTNTRRYYRKEMEKLQ